MKSSPFTQPGDSLSRPAGFLFLFLIPAVTLVPYGPVPVWLAQDLILRWASAIAFILLVLGFLLREKGPSSIQFDFSSLVLSALTGWILLSTRNSLQTFDSFYAFKSFLALLFWWFSLRMLWDRRSELYPLFEKIFFWTAWAAAFYLVATTAAHFFGVRTLGGSLLYPRQGLFPNENVAAGFLGMAFLLGCLKALHREPISRLGLCLIFLAWCLTQSRGAFLSMLLAGGLYLVLNMKEVEEKLRGWGTRQWAAFGVVLLLALIPLAFMVNRLLHALELDPRSSLRLEVWVSGFKMAMAQPLLGFGPGTFEEVYPSFRSGSLWNTTTAFAHNEYLQVAAECGWPALGLVLFFLALLLSRFGKSALEAKSFKAVAAPLRAREAAFYLLFLEAVHNFVDFSFHEWSHRLVLLAVVTFALQEKEAKGPVAASFSFTRPALLASVSLFLVLVLWVLGVGGGRDYLSRTYDLKASFLFNRGKADEAEVLAKGSLALRENNIAPWNVLGALEDLRAKNSAKKSEREKHFRAAREYFQKAIRLSPYSLNPRKNEIQSLVNQGRLEEALDLQNELVRKAPELPTGYIGLGWIFLHLGRPQEALKPAQKAIDLDSYYLPGYLLKAKALEEMGKKEEALKTYETASGILKSVNWSDSSGQVEAGIQRLKAKP